MDRLAKAGVDVIKAYVELGPAHYKAIADAAHRHKLRVHAHVYDEKDVRNAFEAGIDVLTHVGSGGMPLYDPELVRAIAAKGTPVVTTVAHRAFLFPATVDFPERLDDPQLREDFGPEIWKEVRSSLDGFQRLSYFAATDQEMRFAKPLLKQWIDSNCVMGMGTDSGTPMNFHTEALWREIKAHVDAGMSPQRAITAATRINARILGRREGPRHARAGQARGRDRRRRRPSLRHHGAVPRRGRGEGRSGLQGRKEVDRAGRIAMRPKPDAVLVSDSEAADCAAPLENSCTRRTAPLKRAGSSLATRADSRSAAGLAGRSSGFGD